MPGSNEKKESILIPERVLIACVAENRNPFISDVRFLFKSIEAFGGKLAQTIRIAYFVEAADAEIVEELGQFGVIVKIVDRFHGRYPYANKLRMLEEEDDYDVLVALDCDVVVSRDFFSVIESASFMAKPVDNDPLTMNQWKKLFRHFGLTISAERYLTTVSAAQTLSYFNSGVIVIPRQFARPLSEAWKFFILKMEDVYRRFPAIAAYSFFTDQFALALALNKANIPCQALPIEMNFPLHLPVHAEFQPEKMTPYILHHHHRTSNAGVMPCVHENVNETIARMNTLLTSPVPKRAQASFRCLNPHFDNGEFWERRYSSNIKLGSGLGSRGECLVYKQNFLKKVIGKISPANVLDVGCGDLEVTAELPLANYTGIDISKSVIERNRELKPNWSFRAGDFLKIAAEEQLKADLVICLDLLIHEHDSRRYEDMVQKLVQLSSLMGVIGAYELPPRGGFSSDIIAYHEPITETLKRAGANEIQVVGYYRDVSLICYRQEPAFCGW